MHNILKKCKCKCKLAREQDKLTFFAFVEFVFQRFCFSFFLFLQFKLKLIIFCSSNEVNLISKYKSQEQMLLYLRSFILEIIMYV